MGTGLFSSALGSIPTRLYDLQKSSKIEVHEGKRALAVDVAVFIVYSPEGLAPSHYRTMEHLVESGFSILLVANRTLSQQEMNEAAPHVWRIISRPNFGYDFGGYREGILYLIDNKVIPNHTLVLNDSVWFPLRDGDEMLQRMKGWKENIRGYSIHSHRRSGGRPFVQSFFFMFDRNVFESKTFEMWWRNIILSSNKHVVIRKLEMRMSCFFADHGFSVGSVFDCKTLGKKLSQMPPNKQTLFLEHERPSLQGLAEEALAVIRGGEKVDVSTWDEIVRLSQVDGHILKLPPKLLFDVFEVNMLKKLKAGHFVAQRQMIKDGGYLEFIAPEIRGEVADRDTSEEVDEVMRGFRRRGRKLE
jgi:hypothetical protein